MNPHFIFNVLNGLQSALILKSDREISHYIGQLSGLLRMTLDVSKRESISLTEEIEYLKSYVELQRIRLNDRMDYCFDLSRNIEASKIFIPPLLIQPLLENAILHGITPSKNKGILVISLKHSKLGLTILVEDNGVGIEKSIAIKRRYRNHHKSYGNTILLERIDLLNFNQIEKIKFKIGNLNKKGVDSGTSAELLIPNPIIKKLTPKNGFKSLYHEKN
jgi:sensor histidine kinase YesM